MKRQAYENGIVASTLDSNGVGYVYYPNGKIAICCSEASDYQNRYYAYDKDKKNTVLLGIDEHAVGFACSSKRKNSPVEPKQCVLNEDGGLITSNGYISHEWKWEVKRGAKSAIPTELIPIDLNENLRYKIRNKKEMFLEFLCENIKIEIDVSVKQRRESTYLDNAVRQLDGKVIPQIAHVSLKERQAKFNEDVKAQRNKLNPRSENLSQMVSGIVKGLETNFDGIPDRILSGTSVGNAWKNESLASTLREIPRIPISGTETGQYFGFGDKIYSDDTSINLAKTAPPDLLTSKGGWKGSVEVLESLKKRNPPLNRTRVLDSNSGRYSSMLVVNKSAVTATNPTGGLTLGGAPLQVRHWDAAGITSQAARVPYLKDELLSTVSSVITAIFVTRGGDPACFAIERVAELANNEIQNESNQSSSQQKKIIRLIKVDLSENGTIVSEFGIKSIPTFLVFRGPDLIYGGPLGGRKFKLVSKPYRPQVLLIEPNFEYQIESEKLLKKIGCDPYLCLSIQQGIERVRQFSLSRDQSFAFDLVLISSEVSQLGIRDLVKCLNDFVSDGRTVISVMVSALGDKGRNNVSLTDWSNHFTNEVQKFVDPEMCMAAKYAILCPIRAAAIERLLNLTHRSLQSNVSEFGLTPATLVARLMELSEGSGNKVNGIGGGSHPYIGIKMSAEDTSLRGGRRLVLPNKF